MKTSSLVALLGASVGVPYAMQSTGVNLETLKNKAGQVASSATGGAEAEAKPGTHSVEPFEPLVITPGRSLVDLAEILRFDIDPAWVVHRFPRVSTGLSNVGNHGYRVPLVTGTMQDDVAGALTYFFDEKQKCEKITFYGTTGDPRRFVSTVAQLHGLQAVEGPEPGVFAYEKKSWGTPVSQLHIRPATVARAEWSRAKFQIELVLKP